MRYVFFSLVAAALIVSGCGRPANDVNQQHTAERAVSPDAAVMKFDQDTYAFGTITQGDSVVHTFHFTNTGKSPLIITDAQSSCGCTIPSYPKEPVPPGAKGDIKVVFHSAGKEGKIEKTVTINSNAAKPVVFLFLNGEVLLPAKK